VAPQVGEILAKKAENRPITPEEYTTLGQFVDSIERRSSQVKEEAIRVEDETTAAARASVPAAAFQMPLEQAGLKEHVFNILTEAGFETVGDLLVAFNTDSNKVLGLPGVGPKAMQNIEEVMATLKFPEPEPAPVAEAPAVEAAPAEVAAPTAEEPPAAEKPSEVKKEAKSSKAKPAEEPEDEFAKDGVSLDDLFSMKPEIFSGTEAPEDENTVKKGKKGKKSKNVELEFDEELGEVVGRKRHKRGDDGWSEE
jgi:hypothetical protein